MYKSKYGMEDIINWHKETFPKATLEGQKKKFEEEYKEFRAAADKESPQETFEELADMYIVALGETRFSPACGLLSLTMIGKIITDPFLENEDIEQSERLDGSAVFLAEVMKAVDKKMDANKKRKWTYKDGKYKHVKEDEKEETNVHVIKADYIEEVLTEIRKVMESTLKDTKDVQDS